MPFGSAGITAESLSRNLIERQAAENIASHS